MITDQADARADAAPVMTSEHGCRLLTDNDSAEARGPLRSSGELTVIELLRRTAAIIKALKMR